MSKRNPRFVLTRDITLKAGEEVGLGPSRSIRPGFLEGVVALSKDETAYVAFDLADAIQSGLVVEVTD